MAQELSPRLHQRHTAARLAIDPPIMTSEQARRWRPPPLGQMSISTLRAIVPAPHEECPKVATEDCVKELIRTLKAMIA
jgi:hypothetical protein